MSVDEQTMDREAFRQFILSVPVGGEFNLRVTGNSMVPTFLDRTTVVQLKRVDSATYVPHVGEVVLFWRAKDHAFVLHRVYRIRKDGWIVINGDGQTWCEVIDRVQILCTLTHVTRRKKRIPVTRFSFRLWSAIWRPLRPLHRAGAVCSYYWHRIPYKLGWKKDGAKEAGGGHHEN
jgi:hypothetical protein